MIPDWTKLAPHRPLDPGAAEYEPPPSGVCEDIAKWVVAGGSTVLVGGPAGVGKSTELAQVAHRLQSSRVACLVALDRRENMRRLAPDRMLLIIAGKLVYLAVTYLNVDVSHELRAMLWQAGVLPDQLLKQPVVGQYAGPAVDMARLAINEVSRLSPKGRVALVLDGLEKVIDPTLARELFDALGSLPDSVDIVTTVPWHVAFGPAAAEPLVRVGERFVAMRAPEVEGAGSEEGLLFLRGILARRLGVAPDVFSLGTSAARVAAAHIGDALPAGLPEQVAVAAGLSGGLPRVFLQIMADAGTYARLRRNGGWPEDVDIVDAVHDQEDNLRRILKPGDKSIIGQFDGSDGVEMDTEAKVRMLAHGLLLERPAGRRVVLRRHPLLAEVLKEGADA